MEYPLFFDTFLCVCPEGIVGTDGDGNVLLFNPSAERILGYSREEAIGKLRTAALFPPPAGTHLRELLYSENHGGRGKLIDKETEIVHKDGRRIPIRLSCAAIFAGDTEIGWVGSFADLSAGKALEQEFLESEERFRGIVESASDAIISFDADRTIVMANQAAETMLGYTAEELLGMNFRRLIPAKYGDNWEQIERYAAAGGPRILRKYIELSALARTGREIPVQMSMAEKQIRGKRIVTVIVRDISARKAMEEELRILSVTDSLTQLYNRRHLASLARKEMERALRTKNPFSVVMIDVDHFKNYNDTYGHTEGDRVLQAAGQAILANFRTMDSCFRFGGEEFVILLPETSAAGAMTAAERLRIRFSETEFLPVPGGKPVRMTFSIGIAEFHEKNTLDDLIRFADLAMYAAKNMGRNRCISYEYILSRTPDPGAMES
jgi:diguanylate cyclase (GGDEF)-like protein/PAS domain S-box-containing protein